MSETTEEWIYSFKRKILFGMLGILAISIILTMVFISLSLSRSLIEDSKDKTQEVSSAIQSSLKCLMLSRNPAMMQETISRIGQGGSHSIVKAFILDKNGRVAYSSERGEIDRVYDRLTERTCHDCHKSAGTIPSETTLIIEKDGQRLYRNIRVIYNEPTCYGCHDKSDRINGKLIIDRSLKSTYALITSISLIVFGSGVACLIFLVPFLTKVLNTGFNKYIEEIVRQNVELRVLYVMMERLSKTIKMEELRLIVFEIIKESLGADGIDMVSLKGKHEYRLVSWTRGTDTVVRKKVEETDELFPVIRDWRDNKVRDEIISGDRGLIYMPIRKGEANIALIVVRKESGTFEPQKLGLLKAMSSHIAVAFENAFLYHMAITDELTSLYTQRHFRASIEREFNDFEKFGNKMSLLMLDIDNFKKINDTYGHLSGDSVLKIVAGHIMSCIRDDDMAFRYGGEEFSVILPSTGSGAALHVAERIRKHIEEYVFEVGHESLRVTISIGVSSCPEIARTARDIILSADQALYKAKRSGKNRVVMGVFPETQ